MKYYITSFSLILVLSGCGQQATKSAGEGASIGAVSGAVSGLVGALVFGGNPVEAATKGAVYGGTAGATAGAIKGSKVDAEVEAQRQAKAEQVRTKIGDDAFNGLKALVKCDYANALVNADKAKQSANPNYSVSGYWLEVVSYADQDNVEKTNALLPAVIEKDWDINDDTQARENLLQLEDKLVAIRDDYKLPTSCL